MYQILSDSLVTTADLFIIWGLKNLVATLWTRVNTGSKGNLNLMITDAVELGSANTVHRDLF